MLATGGARDRRLRQQQQSSSSSSSSERWRRARRAASGGKTIDIYSSLPLQGATSAQTVPMVNGIKLALSRPAARPAQFTVKYKSLDDSTAAAGEWDPARRAANARKAAADPRPSTTSASSTRARSEVSIPILNQAGIPQVSPANTYVGLTTNEPGSAPGEPQKYYPTGKRTYLRIVPDRLDPGRRRPDGDEAGGLHEGRRGQRQGGLRRRPRHS